MTEAIAFGVASGAFACYYVGGTFIENSTGEKLRKVEGFKNEYFQQISTETIQLYDGIVNPPTFDLKSSMDVGNCAAASLYAEPVQ